MAIENSLLDLSIDGAQGILFTITGSPDLTMYEVHEAAKIITQSGDPEAKVIFGAIIDEKLKDSVRVTVVATGFNTSIKKGFTNNVTPFEEKEDFAMPEIKEEEDFFAKEKEDVSDGGHEKKKKKSIFIQDTPSEKGDEEVENIIENDTEDDELDIPAFLRKKMQK